VLDLQEENDIPTIVYKNRPKNHAIFSCVDERAGAGLTYARPFPKYSPLRVVMRIYLLLPQIESDDTSTKIERLFALKTPGLSPPHLNLERQSDGLVRQPRVS